MFPRIYTTEVCPLDGYEGYSLRVLANPTGQERNNWALGHTGVRDCADCAAARKESTPFCPACTAARTQLFEAAATVFGTSAAQGLDFSSAAAAQQTMEGALIPDELLLWIYLLPGVVWERRSDELKKRLNGSSQTAT